MAAVLGISAYYHDSAAALLVDGRLVAAAQEERFTRKKHDESFPRNAIDFVLREGGFGLDDVACVAFYDKPFLKFERLIETYLSVAPRGVRSFMMAMPVWLREKLFQKNMLGKELKDHSPSKRTPELLFSEHHFSHAASAFYPSPFEEAVVLTLDGVGEWATSTVSIGRGRALDVVREIHFPHSIGLLYSAFTYYLGFKVNSGEYKVMGLAPYGVPRFKDLITSKVVDIKDDGSFHLDMRYFEYATGLKMTNARFAALFGQPRRDPESELLTQFHMDVAASVQAVTEEIVLRMTRSLAKEYGIPNLCLAGGVALNCVANGKVLRDGAFDKIWIQPAAGDAGGAVGAALAAWHKEFGNVRQVTLPDGMSGGFLGPSFSQAEIEAELSACGAVFEVVPEEQMLDQTAEALAAGKAVGWFQGRMEFGPRSLGGRSILGDPRGETMQKTLNLKVKFRESFRPFAPSVLADHADQWFELDRESPYMLLVADVREQHRRSMTAEEQKLFGIDKLNVARSSIPAVTHVDYSARVQTVSRDVSPLYYELIERFRRLTGCPVLVNTSFNVRGEPIVCTPSDAFRCFMGTDIELLVCGSTLVRKERQDKRLAEDYKSKYELD